MAQGDCPLCAILLAGLYVLVEGLADGAGTGVEFLDHAFDALAETGLVEVNGEYVLAAVELLEA